MMSKFEEVFTEPCCFSDGTYVIRGDIDKQEAHKAFENYFGEPVEIEGIEEDFVRFGFAPDFVEDMQGEPCWFTGAKVGKGSKKVWVCCPA